MVSVAIWLASRRSQLTHALLVFAELGAKSDFTPDECRAIQWALGSLAPPLKTSGKLIEGARGAAKKSGVARLLPFGYAKRLGKMAAVKVRCP
jgi:hypothetical protein